MAREAGAAKAKDTATGQMDHRNPRAFERLNKRIAARAFALYEERGRPPGEDLAHWLQAESEISANRPEIRESSSWYVVNIPVRGFRPDELSVGIDSRRGAVVGEKQQSPEGPGDERSDSESLFLVAEWPAEVDPLTACAYIKDQTLTLTVKRLSGGAD